MPISKLGGRGQIHSVRNHRLSWPTTLQVWQSGDLMRGAHSHGLGRKTFYLPRTIDGTENI
jgi:hypothetical protein